MPRKLLDITGTEFVAPLCPVCASQKIVSALQQIEELSETGANTHKASGIWRCHRCFHAYRYTEPI
jgi:ribosomal protein L37AE/L43A